MRATETIYREMLSAYAKRRGGQLQEDCDLSVRLWAAAAQIQALEAQAEWVLGDDGGRYIWLYRDNYNTSYAARALLDTETGQITPVTQALQTGSGAVSLRGKAHDGRWLVVIGADSAGRTTAYGLIDADQFAAGSTDWQPVTMWQG